MLDLRYCVFIIILNLAWIRTAFSATIVYSNHSRCPTEVLATRKHHGSSTQACHVQRLTSPRLDTMCLLGVSMLMRPIG